MIDVAVATSRVNVIFTRTGERKGGGWEAARYAALMVWGVFGLDFWDG
jgi:hypothetical protein